MCTPITAPGWALVDRKTGEPICKGMARVDFRGDTLNVIGGTPPRHIVDGRMCGDGMNGYVDCGPMARYYPNVVDAKWVEVA